MKRSVLLATPVALCLSAACGVAFAEIGTSTGTSPGTTTATRIGTTTRVETAGTGTTLQLNCASGASGKDYTLFGPGSALDVNAPTIPYGLGSLDTSPINSSAQNPATNVYGRIPGC